MNIQEPQNTTRDTASPTSDPAVTSTDERTTLAKGIPGKWFVIPLGTTLTFLVWLVISMALRFQAITDQLKETRSAWPTAADIYSQSFALIESEASQAAAETRSAIASQKADLVKTTMFDKQSVVIKQILDAVGKDKQAQLLLAQFSSHEALQELDKSERIREQLQSGIVGWFTIEGLRLKLPPVFRVE
jgi:hypothetical protein